MNDVSLVRNDSLCWDEEMRREAAAQASQLSLDVPPTGPVPIRLIESLIEPREVWEVVVDGERGGVVFVQMPQCPFQPNDPFLDEEEVTTLIYTRFWGNGYGQFGLDYFAATGPEICWGVTVSLNHPALASSIRPRLLSAGFTEEPRKEADTVTCFFKLPASVQEG